MPDTTIFYRWQYVRGDLDVTHETGGPFLYDVDAARAWSGAHGDELVAAFEQTRSGRWRFTGSDLFTDGPGQSVTFSSPQGALEYLGRRCPGVELTPAVCRCGEPGGECD